MGLDPRIRPVRNSISNGVREDDNGEGLMGDGIIYHVEIHTKIIAYIVGEQKKKSSKCYVAKGLMT
jgi:hypothetical protein